MQRRTLLDLAVQSKDGRKFRVTAVEEFPSVSGMPAASVVDATGEPIDPPLAKCAPERSASGTFAMGTVIDLATRLAKRSA